MEIEFDWNDTQSAAAAEMESGIAKCGEPRKSMVCVRFPGRGMGLTYYNDKFDLKVGDKVFVDGKLEGVRGTVISVSYHFKIRPSDYHRVTALVDTTVHGRFYSAGSHFVTFDRNAIPAEKVMTWFFPPRDEDEYITSTDESAFRLDALEEMNVSDTIFHRGIDYYENDRVEYISVDNHRGYAVVSGEQDYEVEFQYDEGVISGLLCSCPCCYSCKHEVAAMLQLKELLDSIAQKHSEAYEETHFFAAILKSTLLSAVADSCEEEIIL